MKIIAFFKSLFTWIALPFIGVLLGLYSLVYYIAFRKYPVTIVKDTTNIEKPNSIHVDFSMWKSIFIKKK